MFKLGEFISSTVNKRVRLSCQN